MNNAKIKQKSWTNFVLLPKVFLRSSPISQPTPDKGEFLEIGNKGWGQSTNTFDTLFKWVEPTLAS